MSTVRIIAEHTGFSIATISRALNQPSKVSSETLSVIEAAMKELNYEKKEKIKKRSNIFGVIFPNISNPFFAELLGVIEKEAYYHGRCILFFNSRHNLRQEKIALAECKNHGVDGVFLVPHSTSPEHLQTIRNLPFPIVLLTQ
ncbi:MAG: LacI family transcriptional regulator, partial [Psychromonas sp.]|nr:LacI family transcriptional regulator [Psychromonas sp.]